MFKTIKGKLIMSGLFVLLFIALMIVSSQVVVVLFKNTSGKLVIEYNELDAIEELKMSLGNLLIITSGYVVYGNKPDKVYFDSQLHQSHEKLRNAKHVLTDSHDFVILSNLTESLGYVDSVAQILFALDIPEDQIEAKSLLKNISEHVNNGIIDVDILLVETKNEIFEYEATNKTVIKHSTITFLSLGLGVILIIILGGSLFIRNITKPIKELVEATKKISTGDRKVKVSTNSKDELSVLGHSFNEMIDALQRTTVSKDYLDSVLKNMFDSLVVTDKKLKIRSINQATLSLLNYKENEIVGKHLSLIFEPAVFGENSRYNKDIGLKSIVKHINTQNYFITKTSKKIPVLISSAVLKRSSKTEDGLVIVGHDLTEKLAAEQKVENIRKERAIALNEAQEEERMRIATDLHDGLGQMLTAISYAVQNLSSRYNIHGDSNNEPMIKIQKQIDATIEEAKNLAHNLIPIVLKDFGLVVAIENLINRANELYNIKFSFSAYDFNERVSPQLEKVLYRICQESLNNIIKHAEAKNASFQLFKQDKLIAMVIEDDGIGFDADEVEFKRKENKSGIGLLSIKDRVLSFNGELILNSGHGEGTELIIEIPYFSNES